MKKLDATRNAALLVLLVVALAILAAVAQYGKNQVLKAPIRNPVKTHQGS